MYKILIFGIIVYILKLAYTLIHELGHYLTAKILGYSCKIKCKIKKNLMPKMSVVIMKETLPFFDDILISLNGVIFQLILSLFLVLLRVELLSFLSISFINASILNLLPVPCTDGYYIYQRIITSKINRQFIKIIYLFFWTMPIVIITIGLGIFIYKILPQYNSSNLYSLGLIITWCVILLTSFKFILKSSIYVTKVQ